MEGFPQALVDFKSSWKWGRGGGGVLLEAVGQMSVPGGLQSLKIFCSCWILETSKGTAPRTLMHRQIQWLQLTETEFAVEEAETLWLLSELCQPNRARCHVDGLLRPGQVGLQEDEKGKEGQGSHEGWGESPRHACGIGLSCLQSVLSMVGHNIWPPAVALEEYWLPIISVLRLPVPCRCPRYRYAIRNGYKGNPVPQRQAGLGCPRKRSAR